MAKENSRILPIALALVACWCLSVAFVGPVVQPKLRGAYEVSTRDASTISVNSGGQYTGFVPDMQRRTLMNLVVVIATAIPAGVVLGGWLYAFYPIEPVNPGGGVVAGDINGTPVKLSGFLKGKRAKDRELVQGVKGDPTWVLVADSGDKIKDFGVNAVCTHLGCTVPWSVSANKFMCPCHGSQYDENGKVVRGPAPLSLALTKASVNNDDQITIAPWKETDFRDGSQPWCKKSLEGN